MSPTTPVLSIERETAYRQHEAPVSKPPRTATFAEAIDMGMSPADALKKCTPATTKAITKERLITCLDAGLDVHQIAEGFGTSSANIYFQCAKNQIKLSQRKPNKKSAKPVAVDKPTAPEPPIAYEPSITDLEPVSELLPVPPDPVPVPKVWAVPEPVTVPAPPAEPEFIWFDRRENLDTGVLIRESGCIEISAEISTRVAGGLNSVRIGVSRDGQILKLEPIYGALPTSRAGNRRRLHLKALIRALPKTISLPARYIGAWQGAEWTGRLQEG